MKNEKLINNCKCSTCGAKISNRDEICLIAVGSMFIDEEIYEHDDINGYDEYEPFVVCVECMLMTKNILEQGGPKNISQEL